jgi:hypothetical protein
MLVPLLTLPVAITLVAAGGVPNFDVQPSCKGAVAAGFIAPEKNRLQNCLDAEKRTRDKLEGDWNTFPAADRSFCTSAIQGFSPTYTELATCLEMRRDLKRAKPTDDDGGKAGRPIKLPTSSMPTRR